MNFEHFIGLSWFTKAGTPKTQKPCARLRDTEVANVADSASGDPAMVFMFRMASILPMVRASCPLRPAAGLLLDTPRGPFKVHAQNAREDSARELNSTTNVVLFEQRLVTRLVLPLDVIEERTACRDHFQK